MSENTTRWMLGIARTLALLWGAWWTFFGVASAFGEGLNAVGILVHTSVPGLIFLGSAAIAWRWEMAGGILLLLEGLVVCGGYPLLTWSRFPTATIAFVLLTMGLPPLAAGVLFLVHRRNVRHRALMPSP